MASRDDIVIEITPQVLLKAYTCGIFPMAESAEDPALYWIEPQHRGILPLDKVHVPRRLARTLRTTHLQVRIDTDIAGVIEGCAASRPGRRSRCWTRCSSRARRSPSPAGPAGRAFAPSASSGRPGVTPPPAVIVPPPVATPVHRAIRRRTSACSPNLGIARACMAVAPQRLPRRASRHHRGSRGPHGGARRRARGHVGAGPHDGAEATRRSGVSRGRWKIENGMGASLKTSA